MIMMAIMIIDCCCTCMCNVSQWYEIYRSQFVISAKEGNGKLWRSNNETIHSGKHSRREKTLCMM